MKWLKISPSIVAYEPKRKGSPGPWILLILFSLLLLFQIGRGEDFPQKKQYLEFAFWICRFYKSTNINIRIVDAIIFLESRYDLNAYNERGDSGLMGISKLAFLHFRDKNPSAASWKFPSMRTQYKRNIAIGIWYLNYCLKLRQDDLREALVAYRFGPNREKGKTNYKYADAAIEYVRLHYQKKKK